MPNRRCSGIDFVRKISKKRARMSSFNMYVRISTIIYDSSPETLACAERLPKEYP
jgi:hypothetical protein